MVQKADLVLTGDQDTVVEAVAATCRLLSGRGGIVAKRELSALICAGSLLKKTVSTGIQSASYDLRLGDEVWCQGNIVQLTDGDPLFEIPAYSYAIVKAAENAAMPAFVAAQFDVRVGHFLSGIVLSNGPQVDPGYRGELFCMLFNGNSDAKAIRLNDHFATLHFWTTTRNTEAYSGFYSMRQKLANHMAPEVSTGLGGQIEQMVDSKLLATASALRNEMPKDHVGLVLGVTALMATIVIGVSAWAGSAAIDAGKAAAEARQAARELTEAAAKATPSTVPAPLPQPASPAIQPSPRTAPRANPKK